MEELFSKGQLSLIQSLATECMDTDADGKHVYCEGEALDVWKMFEFTACESWELDQLRVLKFACEECERQEDDAIAVYHYCLAWNRAVVLRAQGAVLNEDVLSELAAISVPCSRYRHPGDTVTAAGGAVIGSKPEQVEGDMQELSAMLEAFQQDGEFEHWGKSYNPQTLYERFERIHPLTDGNGRLGKILYNWLAGTLTAPVLPKEPSGFLRI